jgi:FtsH-binding integral membrane protein
MERKEERYREYDREPQDESQESAITPDVRRHLTKVYGTMMAGMGFAAAGAVAGGLAPGLAMAGMIGSLVGVVALAFMDRSRVTLRQNIFLGVTALLGMGLGPLLAATAPGVIFAAGLGTSAIFGGFTLAALKAKQKAMLMMGGPLIGGLFLLLGVSLSSVLLPVFGVTSPAILGFLYNLNLYGGLGIFSLFIAYDTQNMIEQYKAGDDDHVSPALNMFLNVFNIFVRLLQIFRGED